MVTPTRDNPLLEHAGELRGLHIRADHRPVPVPALRRQSAGGPGGSPPQTGPPKMERGSVGKTVEDPAGGGEVKKKYS